MGDAANFTEPEQRELDNEDQIMGLWRMRNQASCGSGSDPPDASAREVPE